MAEISGFTIGCTTSGFDTTGKSFDEIIGICVKSGFIGLEASPSMFDRLKENELEKINLLFRNAGLSIPTYHLPYKDPVKDDIAALYETDRKKVEYSMKKHIDRAVMLGASIGIVHPTTKKDCLMVFEGVSKLASQAAKTLEVMLLYCEQYNFRIAVENMLPYTGERLGCRISHLEEIIKHYDHPLLGFCLDTGHALVAQQEKAMEMFHFMKNKRIAFHLADNAGDRDSHLAPSHGNFPWKNFFSELKKSGFKGALCIEAPPFSFGPDYTTEAWKTMFREISVLADF